MKGAECIFEVTAFRNLTSALVTGVKGERFSGCGKGEGYCSICMTISAGRSFTFVVEGLIIDPSACVVVAVAVVLALDGVGRDVNGLGILMFCNRLKDLERAVEDKLSRDGIGEDNVDGGAGDWDGIGVDGGDDIAWKGVVGKSGSRRWRSA